MDALKNENLALSQARSATLTSCLLDALKNGKKVSDRDEWTERMSTDVYLSEV